MSWESICRFFGRLFAVLGFLVFCLILFIVGLSFYAAEKVGAFLHDAQRPNSPSRHNYTVPHDKRPYIVGIRLNNEIDSNTSSNLLEKLDTAVEEKNAKGILLEVDSPGGAVVPSQEIFTALKYAAQQKPVVAYVRGVAASGAYYSIAPVSYIVCNKASLLGSIGVIMQGVDGSDLMKFLKLTPETIKTGALKDVGSPFRPMGKEDRDYLQNMVNSIRIQFAQDVQNSRHLDADTMTLLSDGRVVLGDQGVTLHLADAIGSEKDALTKVRTLAKVNQDAEVIFYENTKDLSDVLAEKLSTKMVNQVSHTVTDFVTLPRT